MFGAFRKQFGLPSRRRHSQEIEFDVHFDDLTERRAVPLEESPTIPVLMPVFDAAGILRGVPEAVGFPDEITLWRWQPALDEVQKARIDRIHQNVAAGVSYVLEFPLTDFCKMLAKIAHTGAVAEYHIGRIPSMLPAYILGHCNTFTHVIGNSDSKAGCPKHQNWCVEYGIFRTGDRKFLTAKIDLLQLLDGPTYWVVISEADQELEDVVLGRTPRPSGTRGITIV